jgi:predicted methyltransferase
MFIVRTFAACILSASALVATASVAAPAAKASSEAATAALLDAAIANPARTDAQRARDPYRHPKETLLFFGLTPGMTVVEVSPGAGWYADIIAPVVKGKGRYVAAHNNPAGSPGGQKQRAAFIERTKADAERFGTVAVTSFGKGIEGNLAAPGSADMVLTFRNVHNWRSAGFAEDAFKAFYAALKPGGVLGVVEHRLPEGRADNEDSLKSGYVKESEVIRLAEAAGFKLVAKSEVNANPKDTADYPKGVWTLPPTYTLGDTDRAKYAAIGESDRMTLKFVKPAN